MVRSNAWVWVMMFWLAASSALACDGGFQLVADRRPAAAILLTQAQQTHLQSIAVAREMLADFNSDLAKSAGCSLPILAEDDGRSRLVAFEIQTRQADEEDRFDITFPDDRTLLITGSATSLRWALNHMLETLVGVRYLAASEAWTHYPQVDQVCIPRAPIRVAPSFPLSRRLVATQLGEDGWNRRMGAYFQGSRPGASVYRVPMDHHLARYVFPVERYARQGRWPDAIFPVIEGQRQLPYRDVRRGKRWQDYTSGWQPCLTAEASVKEAAASIITHFDAHPDLHGVTIALNDLGHGFCHCPDCQRMMGQGRTMTGHRDFSDLYYQWANRVALAVASKHPGKYLGTLAYRETLNPPSFKLHSSIVPYVTYDHFACVDPQICARWTDLMQRWRVQADALGHYEYGWGGQWYLMPRVGFALQQSMMRMDHANGVRAYMVSADQGVAEDGPKRYVYHKLMWDVDLDMQALLDDWCAAAVGKEAGPSLRAYYSLWEEIWQQQAVKTSWFLNTRGSLYLSLTDRSYLYAVRQEDLPRLRQLMDTVLALAERHGDDRQRQRARWLGIEHDYVATAVREIGGDLFPPTGQAQDAAQALAYLARLPEVVHAADRRADLHARRAGVAVISGLRDRWQPGMYDALAKVASHSADPAVLAAIHANAQDTRLPMQVRRMLDVLSRMAQGQPVANLMVDGGFEQGNADWRQGAVSTDHAHAGRQSLRLPLASPRRVLEGKVHRDVPCQAVAPGWYYVSCKVRVEQPHPDVESRVRLRATVRARSAGGSWQPVAHWDSPHVSVQDGQWVHLALVGRVEADQCVYLDWISFDHFNPGDVAYLDEVYLTPLGQ